MLRDTFFTKAEPEEAKSDTSLELPIDLFRSGDKLIARAPIAGANLNHISVSVGPQRLTIHKAEHIVAHTDSPDRIYLEECHWGELSRAIDLPLPVNPDTTRATLTDGVLTIAMPLINPNQSKLIRIKE
ncbi:MAG: Hsp20/alpha crystallin family protein [Patescibacteria group bacterium]|jgi:HSP20 family molecular chaperone IbpA